MVRIKFTGPAAVQPVQVQKTVPKSASSVQAKNRTELQRPTELTYKESLSLKQQQSLEMVQIMLHVSVGTLLIPTTPQAGECLTRLHTSSGPCFIFGRRMGSPRSLRKIPYRTS